MPIQDEATTPTIDKGQTNTEVLSPSEPLNTAGYSSSAAFDGSVKRKAAFTSASGKLQPDTTSTTTAYTTRLSSTSPTTASTTTTTTAASTTASTTTSTTTTTSEPSTTTGTTASTTGSTTTTSTTSTTTTTRVTTTPTPRKPAKTTPLLDAPSPSPTPVRWEEAYRPYEGCYVPVTGGNLMQIVLEAQKLYSKSNRTCPAINVGGLEWPDFPYGQASLNCLSGEGFATWSCERKSPSLICWTGSPNINNCASKKLQKLLKLVEAEKTSLNSTQTVAPPTAEETISVTSQLLEVTTSENTTMDDVIVTSNVITRLTERLDNVQDTEQISTIMDNILKVGSNLVSEEKSEVWENMAPEDKVRSASTLMVAMETATLSMVDEITEPSIIVKKEENIDLKMAVLDVTKMEKQELTYESDSDFTSVSIPKETLVNFSQGSLTKAVFITHYSMSSFLGGSQRKKAKQPTIKPGVLNEAAEPGDKTARASDDSDDEKAEDEELGGGVNEVESRPRIASFILSASLGTQGHIRKLPKPITFTMKLTQIMKHDQIALCSFWNISNGDSLGFWSQDGCQVVTSQSNTTHTTCQCDHMTNFAILLDVHGLKLDHVHQSILNLVTIIGCVISCTALLASWVTFQCFSSLQGERNSIHKNLVVCLLIAEIIFVAGIDQYERKVLCSVIAGFLHFFFLAAFTWMFLEGLHIIFMLVQVFDSNRSRLPYYYFAGYGVPLIVISASCLFYYEGYGTENYCWLKHERYFIWAFAGPVALILLVNALFLAYAMSTVCRHSEYVFSSKDKTTGSGIRAWIQGALALEILLGLTWTLGYFFISDASVPMAYIFSIANSLQGLFIFVFHCLLNKKAQKEYRSVVHSVVSRSSSSVGTHSTLTKRSNQHSHELNQGYHQRLTHNHSTA